MDYVYLGVGIVVVLTCFYLVISPFFTGVKRSSVEGEQEGSTLEDIYRLTNDLEMDYLMKKITEQDYQTLKAQYHLLAAEQMKQKKPAKVSIKKQSGTSTIDREIEKELEKVRLAMGRDS